MIRVFFILVCLFFCGCDFLNLHNIAPSKEERLVDKIFAITSRKIEKKHQLYVYSNSAGMPGGIIKSLGLSFHAYRSLSKEQLRALLIDCVQEFLVEINSNEAIRPYLKNYPFTPENVSIGIIVKQADNNTVYYPNIGTASANQGILWYATRDENDFLHYKTMEEETYEEAISLLKGNASIYFKKSKSLSKINPQCKMT